jgi:hypothetical protein
MWKKSLKIPKEQSESVYRRRTDNTMAKRKSTKDKKRSTKHTYKTKDRVTRPPPPQKKIKQPGDELRCSGRVSSFCSTSDTRRVNLVANPVISHERGKHSHDRINSLIGDCCADEYSLTLPHEGAVPSQTGDHERSYICALRISILPLFLRLSDYNLGLF